MIKLIDILNEITEGKQVGTLYHFTSESYFEAILKSNKLKASGRYISFTRNKNLFLNPPRLAGGFNYCFIIDGDKLATNYKLEPFNDPASKKDEYEERVVFNRNMMFIDNLDKYVIKIIILGDTLFKSKSSKSPENLDKIIKQIQIYMNVPIEIIFKDSYPYKSSPEFSKFQDSNISGQKPKKNQFTTQKWIPDPTLTPDEKIQRYIKDRGRYGNVSLDLSNSHIKSLPDNLTTIHSLLDIRKTQIDSLPNNLTAGGINAQNSLLSSIPNNLNVNVFAVKNTPLIKNYSKEEIKKMIEDKGGYVGRVTDLFY